MFAIFVDLAPQPADFLSSLLNLEQFLRIQFSAGLFFEKLYEALIRLGKNRSVRIPERVGCRMVLKHDGKSAGHLVARLATILIYMAKVA